MTVTYRSYYITKHKFSDQTHVLNKHDQTRKVLNKETTVHSKFLH